MGGIEARMKETGQGKCGTDDMAGERDRWWISANTVMNIRFASNAENSLNCREPVSHSVWTQLYGVSNISLCLRQRTLIIILQNPHLQSTSKRRNKYTIKTYTLT